MKNNTTRTLAIVVVMLTAATLVVGAIAATAITTQTAFAVPQKKPGHDGSKKKTTDNGSGNGNGNTVTIEECKNRGSASGFDTALDQECENLICTHPGENATCTEEGVISAPTLTPTSTPTPTPEPITTTLRVIKKFVCLTTDPNCSLIPCTITVAPRVVNQPPLATFPCQSAIGNGVVVTLQPGDIFRVIETNFGPFGVTFDADCSGTIAEGQHLTCTFTNTERES